MKILVRSIVKRALELIKEDPKILLPYFLVNFLIFGLTGAARLNPSLAYLEDNLIVSLGLNLLSVFCFLYVVVYAYNRLEGLSVNIAQVASLIFKKLLPLIVIAVAVFFVQLFFTILVVLPGILTGLLVAFFRGNISAIIFIVFVGGFLSIIIALKLIAQLIRFLAFPYAVALFEAVGPFASFRRSAEIVDQDFWAVVRASLVIIAASVLMAFLISLVTVGGALWITGFNLPPLAFSIFILVLLAPIPAFFITFNLVLTILMYKSLSSHLTGAPVEPVLTNEPVEATEPKEQASWFTPLHTTELIIVVVIVLVLGLIFLKPLIGGSAKEIGQPKFFALEESSEEKVKPTKREQLSPKETVEEYYSRLERGDKNGARKLVYQKNITTRAQRQLADSALNFNKTLLALYDISIGTSQTSGNQAVVLVTYTTDYGKKMTKNFELIKDGGVWKIKYFK